MKRAIANRSTLPASFRALPLILLLLPVSGGASGTASSGIRHGDHIQVELISEMRTVRAGEPFWVALRLLPEPGWHTYWRNPGDSGLETRIRWTLPEGLVAGEILWPVPRHLPVAHIVNYGMEGETALLTRIEMPDSLPADAPIRIQASVAWLVCKEDCVPGFAELELEPPLGPQALPAPEHQQVFADARERLPLAAPTDWDAVFEITEGNFVLVLSTGQNPLPRDTEARFFPVPTDVVDHSAPQAIEPSSGGMRLVQNRSPLFRSAPDRVHGVLVLERAGTVRGFEITAPLASPAGAQAGGSLSGEVGGAQAAAAATHSSEPFSEGRLEELRASGRPVFVNMTADWCTTCLANERRALDTEPVRTAFRAADVAYLKGDWTEQDPEITKYLARHGSRGVPLYVLYPPGPDAAPRRLPPTLTPEIVVEALQAVLDGAKARQP